MTQRAKPAPEFKRGVGLKFKFSLAVILLIVCVMGLVTVVVRYRVRETLLDQMMDKGLVLTRGLAANASEALATDDRVRLSVLVDQTKRQENGILTVALTDSQNRIRTHSDYKQENQSYVVPADASYRSFGLDKIIQYFQDNKEVMDFEVPITISGAAANVQKQVGNAHVVYSLTPITKVVADTLQNIAYVALGGLGLGILVSLLLVSRITRPVRQLADAARSVGAGNLEQHLTVRQHDELGQLAATFNRMAADLKHAQADLIIKERLQNEMEIARHIQEMLVPKTSPKLPGYSISMLYRSAEEVSGDYFDFIDLGEGSWGMTVADVSGKGVPGALVMAQTRSVLRSIANITHSPSKVLSKTNLLLYRDLPENMFVTISYMVLDAPKRTVVLSRAGHLAAVIYRTATRNCEVEMPTGIAIGISDPETFDLMLTERMVKLSPGDFILLYTDGVDEATNASQELFGSTRLVQTMKEAARLPAGGIVEFVDRAVQNFVGAAPQSDDMTMILIKVDEKA